MNRETAVELLVDAIRGHIAEGTLDAITLSRAKMISKAMEREQIKESYKAGFNLRDSFNWECDAPWDTEADLKHNEQEFDKYYIETYSGGKHE